MSKLSRRIHDKVEWIIPVLCLFFFLGVPLIYVCLFAIAALEAVMRIGR